MPEWLMGTDCKSVDFRLHRFKSYSTHISPFCTSCAKPISFASIYWVAGGTGEKIFFFDYGLV
jgi:hypothetical protein